MIYFPRESQRINPVARWILVVLLTAATVLIIFGPVKLLPPPPLDEIAEKVILGINAEREELGVQPLIVNEHLMLVARWRSEDMVAGDYFSHDPPPGHSTLDELIARLGYDWQYRPVENIAAVRPLLSASADPFLVVDTWRDSPGHWRWAMSPYQVMTGVGVAVADDGTVIATQLFWGENSAPPNAYEHNRDMP
jgi:uncharacterized protein YkwD